MDLTAALRLTIRYADLGTDTCSTHALQDLRGRNHVITLNTQHAPNHPRFSLVRQLSHLVNHRVQVEAGIIIDGARYRSRLPEPMEWEANRYAAMLLMPFSAVQHLWERGFRSSDDFGIRLGVSTAAAALRLDQLRPPFRPPCPA
jgi:Zn-dependent peptidase ImmA (M78 family)